MGLSKDESAENHERAWHRQTGDLVALLELDYATEGFRVSVATVILIAIALFVVVSRV
jgi:hypothetical protein